MIVRSGGVGMIEGFVPRVLNSKYSYKSHLRNNYFYPFYRLEKEETLIDLVYYKFQFIKATVEVWMPLFPLNLHRIIECELLGRLFVKIINQRARLKKF